MRQRGLSFLIEIDGGINAATGARTVQAGVDVLVAGSAVFGAKDYAAAIASLRAAAGAASRPLTPPSPRLRGARGR